MRTLLTALLIALAFEIQAAPGDLDSTFDGDGKTTVDFLSQSNYASDVARQTDGKLVITGHTLTGTPGTGLAIAVTRLHTNGTLDASFANAGRYVNNLSASDDYSFAVAIQSDGKIVIAGYSGGYRKVLRLNTDGTLDDGSANDTTPADSFGTAGVFTSTYINPWNPECDVAIQSDGKIVVVGASKDGTFSGNDWFHILRLTSNGTPDPNFGSNGQVFYNTTGAQIDQATCVLFQDEGSQRKIVVGGYWTDLNNTSGQISVVRYTDNGTPDSTFGTVNPRDGRSFINFSASARATAMTLQDDKIVVVGYTYPNAQDAVLARLDANGALDMSFDGDGTVTTDINGRNDRLTDVHVREGKIIATGVSGGGSSGDDFLLLQYSGTGALDGTFGAGGLVLTDFGANGTDISLGSVLQPDGKVVLVGQVQGPAQDFGAARYHLVNLRIVSITKSGASFVLQGLGIPNAVHKIHATDDLSQPFDPNPIGTATADGLGNFQFTDTTGLPRRFYRVVY